MTKVKLDIVEVPEHEYSWHDYSFDDQEKAVKLLHHWQYNNTYSFSDVLFNLFMKADKDNINKLRKGFNLYYQVLNEWHKSGNYGNDLPDDPVEYPDEKYLPGINCQIPHSRPHVSQTLLKVRLLSQWEFPKGSGLWSLVQNQDW